jgi:hypothetical protein
VRGGADPHFVLPRWGEGEALPFNLEFEVVGGPLCSDRVWPAERAGGT